MKALMPWYISVHKGVIYLMSPVLFSVELYFANQYALSCRYWSIIDRIEYLKKKNTNTVKSWQNDSKTVHEQLGIEVVCARDYVFYQNSVLLCHSEGHLNFRCS